MNSWAILTLPALLFLILLVHTIRFIRMKSEEKRFLIMKKDSDKKKNNWIN